MRGVSSWTRVFWTRRRGGAICPVFSQQPCWLSFVWERAAFRQRSAVRIAISVLSRASTATRAANRAELPRSPKETNCDAIPENGDTSITTPLQPPRRPRHPSSRHPGRCLLRARVTQAGSSLAVSTGISGLMMPSLRRRIPGLESGSGCTAQALIRPAGRRLGAGDGDLSATSPLLPCACSMLSLSSRFGERH
jgi:hypothetical protein